MNKYLERINNFQNTTYGAEIEAAGMRRDTILDPETEGTWCKVEGSVRDRLTGLGNDPLGQYNLLGGEIQVKYAHSTEELYKRMLHLLNKTKCPEINQPSTSHVHIRIPELNEDENLDILKHLVLYTQKELPKIINHISPLPDMEFIRNQQYESEDQKKMFIRAYKDKHTTRHSIYSDKQIDRMMKQTTFVDFINAIPNATNSKTGAPMWGIDIRRSINYAKMRYTDGNTIEFRMFSATSNPEIIKNIVEFPKKFIECALNGIPPDFVYDLKWPDYYNWINEPNEISLRWIKTDHDKIDRNIIIQNIKQMLLSNEITLSNLGNPVDFWKKELTEDEWNLINKNN